MVTAALVWSDCYSKKSALRPPAYLKLIVWHAAFCLEAILAPQPFREWPGTDSYLGAPEH
jgi:hypothetical protein